jgi:hypothetical protein
VRDRSVGIVKTAQRIASTVLIVAAIVVGAADAAIYAIATTSLGAGTTAAGFDLLDLANRLAAIVAALAGLAVVVRTLGARRIAVPAFTLLLVSGITAVVAVGLWTIGVTLFALSNQAVLDAPAGQVAGSPELQLSSLISGVMGSGLVLAPVPAILAVTSALIPLIAVARRVVARVAVVEGRTGIEPA